MSNRLAVIARSAAAIAVGTLITERPPHRTVRAAFPHTAPTSGVDGELAVCAPAPVTRLAGTEPGPCCAGSHSPRSPPLAPPTPQQIALPCSPASQLLRRGLTSHARASSATAPHLPDAGPWGRRVHRPNMRPPRFRRLPFVRDVFFDHGRASVPRIAGPHMLPSTLLTSSASAILWLSRLNSTPHTIAVYASHPPSPATTQHSLPGARYGLPGPVSHRQDHASFPGAQAIHSFFPWWYGLLRGACHRARIRATRWLAMTLIEFRIRLRPRGAKRPRRYLYLPPQKGRGEYRAHDAPAVSCAFGSGRTHTSNNEYTGITRHPRTQWF